MSRVDLHNMNITKSEDFLKYDKLDRMSLKEVIKNGIEIIFILPKFLY